jgi:RHS repeat-associated protein
VTQAANTTESYSYDAAGNRTASLGVSSYTTNASNELTATSNASYTYDGNGNTLTKTMGPNTTTYAWDYDNRLTTVTLPGSGGTVTFKYDPLGRRIYKSSSTATSVFAYDGDNLLEETNSSGAAVSRYAQTQNIDEPLAMARGGTTSFYNADGLGSLTSLTSGTGALAQTYTFDSFGRQIGSSGSLANPFQFTGREFDPETGLYFYRARYYDPQAGRFMAEDPTGFEGGVNFYAYVGNNPVNYVDPSGLCREPNRFWECVKGYYGLGTGATRVGTVLAAVPFPKSWVGLPRALGSGSWTNLPSWLSLGRGTAVSGSNLLRIGGRIAGPVAIGSIVIDAAALAMCEADYTPAFLYTIAKYDPFK